MENVRKTTYIQFLYPGGSKGEPQRVKIHHGLKGSVPKNAIGFRFLDILSVVVDVDSEKIKFTSKPINVSPIYYYGGKIYTVYAVAIGNHSRRATFSSKPFESVSA